MNCKELFEIEKVKLDVIIDNLVKETEDYLKNINIKNYNNIEDLVIELMPLCKEKQNTVNTYIHNNFNSNSESVMVNGLVLNTCPNFLNFLLQGHFSNKYNVFHNLCQSYVDQSVLSNQ